jgi:hypothetical protein
MAQLIKPGEVKIITKDGECQVSISIELTINLNSDISSEPVVKKSIVEEKKSNDWMIPDFEAAPRVNFGKKGE